MSVETKTSQISPKKSANVGKQFGLVASATVVSKGAGFVRDVLAAKVLGTKIVADTYNLAYQFTGNILVLFGGLGGPFHSTMLSLLASEKEDREKAGLLVTQVLVFTAAILAILSFLLYALAPYIVQMLGEHNMTVAQRQLFERELCIQLQWMSPLILISGVIGVIYGVSNAYGKIVMPSLSPMIASISIIIGLLLYDWQHKQEHKQNQTHPTQAVPLAIATMIGAFGQLAAQIPDLLRCDLKWRLILTPSPLLIRYIKMLTPPNQTHPTHTLTTYVDMCVGCVWVCGGWTAVVNSNRLVQLPLGILATAMLVPMLPRFAQSANEGDEESVKTDYKKALQFMIFLSMPITAIMLALPEAVVRTLFKRGEFDELSVHLVGLALVWLAPQIVFYLGRDLITRVFFAYKDMRTPFYVAVAAIIVKAALDWLFIIQLHLGVKGISLATTLITIMNLSLLHTLLKAKIGSLKSSTMIKPLVAITIAGLACAVASFETYNCWKNFASFSKLSTSPWRVERAMMVPLTKHSADENQKDVQDHTDATPPGGSGTPPAVPSAVPSIDDSSTSIAASSLPMDWNECLLSMIIGLGLSCTTGFAAYLAICMIGRLDELNMLAKRLPLLSRK